jgi:S-(hydroxymethyl)glutathione dehydrogenase/alcohol dehydrogenase
VRTLAAVLVETGRPLALEELEIPVLAPGQTLVEIAYSGVCHTQVLECRGHRGTDPWLPHCLGHEGTGIVRDVGPGTTKVRAGDPVLLSWIKGSGRDVPASVYRQGERRVNAGAITTFARLAVVSENRVTRLETDVPLREATVLGCALPTGVGAVLNTARARPGDSLAVFGAGGVGLSAVAAAVLAGCAPVIAIDVRPEKLALAVGLGATHCVNASQDDPLEALAGTVRGGLDVAIEATGRPDVMRQALASVRPRGGVAVVIGNARHGEQVALDPWELNCGKRLLGTWGGDTDPDRDFPRYARLLTSGRLPLGKLLSRPYRLEQVNRAIDDLEAGTVARPLIDPRMG